MLSAQLELLAQSKLEMKGVALELTKEATKNKGELRKEATKNNEELRKEVTKFIAYLAYFFTHLFLVLRGLVTQLLLGLGQGSSSLGERSLGPLRQSLWPASLI